MKPTFLKCSPHLPVRSLQQTLQYYQSHLGFTNPWTFGEKDGGLRRDELHLLFAEDENFTNEINNQTHRLPLLWFVRDIENIYAEFKARGINIADELRQHPYGLREFAFIDINGYYIRVAEETQS